MSDQHPLDITAECLNIFCTKTDFYDANKVKLSEHFEVLYYITSLLEL